MDEVPGVEVLSEDELAALVRFMRALVDQDEAFLREAGAYDQGDPYEFTRRWRLWGPRRPDHAARRAEDVADARPSTGGGSPRPIDFDMFTVQGRISPWRSTCLLARTVSQW